MTSSVADQNALLHFFAHLKGKKRSSIISNPISFLSLGFATL